MSSQPPRSVLRAIRLTLRSQPFAERSGRGIRVAVIDSGIAAGHPHVGAVSDGVSLVADVRSDYGDRHGHGTAVAAAIREKAPDAELLAVRVFDRTLVTSADALAAAMRWAADHGAQLINLSLGTPNEERSTVLREALDYALRRGALVVAAMDLDGRMVLPGGLSGAIAVRLDRQCERDELIVDVLASARLQLAASGYPRPIPGVPPERNLYGISLAVANATGFLARLLEGRNAAAPAGDILASLLPR
ncbi:MAG: subtilisin-like serine protease QhpE [Gemmatimonadaceae bacterium]